MYHSSYYTQSEPNGSDASKHGTLPKPHVQAFSSHLVLRKNQTKPEKQVSNYMHQYCPNTKIKALS